MITINVDLKPSFQKKVNPETYKEALKKAITQTTFEAESRCKKECPVRTGTLMRGHSSDVKDLEGTVSNGIEYAEYVIHGTRYQSANNYPGRVVSSLKSQNYATKAFKSALKSTGVLWLNPY